MFIYEMFGLEADRFQTALLGHIGVFGTPGFRKLSREPETSQSSAIELKFAVTKPGD